MDALSQKHYKRRCVPWKRRNPHLIGTFRILEKRYFQRLGVPTENRLIQVQRSASSRVSVEQVHDISGIDPWFLQQIALINEKASELKSAAELDSALLYSAKRLGFSDSQIGELRGLNARDIYKQRHRLEVLPV